MRNNIGSFLGKRGFLNPHNEALVEPDTGRRFTYRELDRRANRVANALAADGVGTGDRVGILLVNGIEFVETFFAIAKLGAVVVPLNWRLVPDELEFILKDSGTKALVFQLASLTDVRFTGTNMLTTYRTAAILLNWFDSLSTVDNNSAGSYQYAIWKLFTPAAGDFGNSAALLTNAQHSVALGGDANAYEHFRVFTPQVGASSNQEFLGMDYGNQLTISNPEPTTFLTIGSGLLILAWAARRHIRS